MNISNPLDFCNTLYANLKSHKYKEKTANFLGKLKTITPLSVKDVENIDKKAAEELKEIRQAILAALKISSQTSKKPTAELEWLGKLMLKTGTSIDGKKIDEETRQLALQHFGFTESEDVKMKDSPSSTLVKCQQIHNTLKSLSAEAKSKIKGFFDIQKIIAECVLRHPCENKSQALKTYSEFVDAFAEMIQHTKGTTNFSELSKNEGIVALSTFLQKNGRPIHEFGMSQDTALEYFGYEGGSSKKKRSFSTNTIQNTLTSPTFRPQKKAKVAELQSTIVPVAQSGNTTRLQTKKITQKTQPDLFSQRSIITGNQTTKRNLEQTQARAATGATSSAVGSSSSPTLKGSIQRVYSLADGDAFLQYNSLTSKQMLALKVIHKNNNGTIWIRYVKFRNLRVETTPPKPSEASLWIPLGNPPEFFIKKADFDTQLSLHKAPEKFGPFADIETAAKMFEQRCTLPMKLCAARDEMAQVKLTIGMDASGTFHAIERKTTPLGMGSYKLVQSESRITETGKQEIAKGRPYKDTEHPYHVSEIRKEISLTQFLIQKGVPHVPKMQEIPGQNIRKTRIEMEKMQGDMLSIAHKDFSQYSMYQRLHLMENVAATLEKMHEIGWCHGDVKLGNFLYRGTEGFLSDYGETKEIGEETSGGTFPSPECSLAMSKDPDNPYLATPTNDCWAYGIALYGILYGKDADKEVEMAHFSNGPSGIKKALASISKKLDLEKRTDKLIYDLLFSSVSKRPSMKEVRARLQEMLKSEELYKTLQKHHVPHISNFQPWEKDRIASIKGIYWNKASEKTFPKLTREQKIHYITDIAETLEKMHQAGFTQNNLNASKLLLSTKSNEVFLTDFSTCTKIGEELPQKATLSPEYIHEQKPTATEKNDCFAFGLTLLEIFHPEKARRFVDRFHDMDLSEKRFYFPYLALIAELDLKDPVDTLIRDLLQIDPTRRPSMQNVFMRLKDMR
jgi:serine/threonine protein kinase